MCPATGSVVRPTLSLPIDEIAAAFQTLETDLGQGQTTVNLATLADRYSRAGAQDPKNAILSAIVAELRDSSHISARQDRLTGDELRRTREALHHARLHGLDIADDNDDGRLQSTGRGQDELEAATDQSGLMGSIIRAAVYAHPEVQAFQELLKNWSNAVNEALATVEGRKGLESSIGWFVRDSVKSSEAQSAVLWYLRSLATAPQDFNAGWLTEEKEQLLSHERTSGFFRWLFGQNGKPSLDDAEVASYLGSELGRRIEGSSDALRDVAKELELATLNNIQHLPGVGRSYDRYLAGEDLKHVTSQSSLDGFVPDPCPR